jgi:hypothetical protein
MQKFDAFASSMGSPEALSEHAGDLLLRLLLQKAHRR